MFGTIASRYDLVNHILSFNIDKHWRKKAARIVLTSNPKVILDAACGTADLAIEMHRQMPEAVITGIDISEEMLDLGRKKILHLNNSQKWQYQLSPLSNPNHTSAGQPLLSAINGIPEASITLQQGNAVAVAFEDEIFDAVTIAFGIRNIDEKHKALREFHRVLKKNGKLMVLEFSLPEKGLFSILYKLYFNHILPYIGGLISGNLKAYSYFVRSVREFPAPAAFIEMLGKTGFALEKATPLTGGAAWIYLASKSDK